MAAERLPKRFTVVRPGPVGPDVGIQSSVRDGKWLGTQVRRFARARPRYVLFARDLEAALRKGCEKLAPLAIITSRTKTISSFAEKLIRKRPVYAGSKLAQSYDPLQRVTDLCGVRVIVQTTKQLQAVCRFIKDNFEVDWRHSEDASRRLPPREFGYRSVHYVVSFLRENAKANAAHRKTPGLKGEVQVRTLLEHAWADIGHDVFYKPAIQAPPHLQRRSAGLAAILEAADREFSRLLDECEEYQSHFGAFLSAAAAADEIRKARLILGYEPNNLALATKTARLAFDSGNYDETIKILEPYAVRPDCGVQSVLGMALCEKHRDAPRSAGFRRGRQCLTCASDSPAPDAATLCALAEAWTFDDENKTRELLQRAICIEPADPVALGRHLEFEIAHHHSAALIGLATPMIHRAMDRCQKHIEARADLPRAYINLAVFHLLLREPYEALAAAAGAVRLATGSHLLSRALETLKRLRCVETELPGLDWFQRFLLLELAVRFQDVPAREELKRLASRDAPSFADKRPIVMLAGACAESLKGVLMALRPHLLRAFERLSGSIISGGTRAGVASLAGDLAQKSRGRIRAIGYVPKFLPAGVQPDANRARYRDIIATTGHGFSPLESLQAWTDLIVAGIDPHWVKVLGVLGGQISQAEYRIALALGARLALIESGINPEERLFDTPAWLDEKGKLARLPQDAMTIRAFLLIGELPVEKPEFEAAARQVHDNYLRAATPVEPSLQPWTDLDEQLKRSCFHQIAYAENILKTAGLGVRPLTDRNHRLFDMDKNLGRRGVERLAEMEHGRWNTERILAGWRWAAQKNISKRRSPYLIPWNQLPAVIQRADLEAIRCLPEAFRAAGLEIYEL